MKREAFDCTKMKRLCRRLNLPLWQGVGLMESIWLLTGKECPRGDIGRYSDEDIALGIDYRGNETELIEVLVESGWLQRHVDYRLVIQDWHEYAENWVRIHLARHRLTFWNGALAHPNQHLRVGPETRHARRRARLRLAGGDPSIELRRRIFERDGSHCKYCGALTDLTIDHVTPIVLGGRTEEENLQILCRSCNGRKRDKGEIQ